MTDEDQSPELAARLGMSVDDFVAVFGAGWTEVEGTPWHDFDADPSGGLEADVTPWMISGRPPQLMIRVFDSWVHVARPVGTWSGPGELRYHAADRISFDRWQLDDPRTSRAIKDLERRRRREFRYCAYCREAKAPEERMAPTLCYGCASTWHGVVY